MLSTGRRDGWSIALTAFSLRSSSAALSTGIAVLLALGLTPSSAWACASCGCTLSSDAAMGFSALAGWRLNLEYDYLNQDQLRHGTSTATPAEVVNQPSDPTLNGGEIEHDTLNRYISAGLSYSPNADWNINLLVPYVLRGHTTYGVQTAPYTAAETAPDQLSSVRVSGLGDIKLIGSYQGLLPTHNFGLQLGVKLPTGRYGTAVNFDTGPNAGTPLDASLQPGTGSTDVIVGTYYYQAVSQNFDAFVNARFQSAVAHRQNQSGNDFRPGNQGTLSFGLRYEAHPEWVPQLQINVTHKSSDQGALADRFGSGGSVAYLSPGLTVKALSRLHLYGFVQLPVYSQLDGYQLFPRWTATAGASYAF
jgi:hypothetical protein